MPATFNNFTTGSSAQTTDYLVGFTSAAAGGERKWTLATLKSAILAGVSTGGSASPVQVRVAATIDRSGRNVSSAYLPGMWYNVRSITDVGTYSKTVNFQTPLPNANYLVFCNAVGTNVKPTTALNYETRAWGKAYDRINVFHQNESYLDREASFDIIVLQ